MYLTKEQSEMLTKAVLSAPTIKAMIHFIINEAEHRRDCAYHYNRKKPCSCGLLAIHESIGIKHG